jgi:UPF0271 protein
MEIDLNSDLGEGFGAYRMGDDEALMDLITSANVACGYHAGDPVIMDKTVRLALARGVDLGAHVSYPDLMGFGRRPMQMDLSELEKHVLYQLGALYGIATAAGHRITHLNAHGALGNQVCADRDIAEALVRAVAAFDRDIVLLVLSGTELEHAAKHAGLRAANLFLADRAYDDRGRLVPRKVAGSVIKDDAAVVRRVRKLLDEGTITTFDGGELRIAVQSILVHSDTPGAVELATLIRGEIEAGGGRVVPLSRILARQ